MNRRIGKVCLLTLCIVFAIGVAHAYTQKSDATVKSVVSGQTAKDRKAAVKKAVDINSASKAELKTLHGIDEARANKIIAGRPYLSKAFLVTRNIIPAGVYQSIKGRIIAIQK